MAGPRQRRTFLTLLVLLAGGALVGCVSDDGSGGASPPASEAPQAEDGNATASSSGPDRDEGNASADGGDPTANVTTVPPVVAGPSYPTSFSTWGCETTFTMLEVRRSWAARQTPPGFEPITFFPASAFVPQAPNRTVRASFLVASNHCDRITYHGPGSNATVRTGVQKMYYGVFVDPPDAYDAEEKIAVYPLRFVTTHPGEADLLSDWGLPAAEGSVSLGTKVDRPRARSWTLEAASEGLDARVDLQTEGARSAGDEPSTFRIYSVAEHGTPGHAMDYEVRVGNSTQNVVAAGAMNALVDVDASDAPYPGPVPSPVAITRWTPSDKVAQHAELVNFDR